MCSIRKVGISPPWISFEGWCLRQAFVPKRCVEGAQQDRDLTRQVPLLALLACC